MKKLVCLAVLCATLSGPVQGEGVSIIFGDGPSYSGGRQPFNINGREKRLNTADCSDLDDWYLDGYRVARTYAAYYQTLLAQRVQFCRSQGIVGSHFQAQWLQGFRKAGGRLKASNNVKGHKTKSKAHKKAH